MFKNTRFFSTTIRRYPFLAELGLTETNAGVYHSGAHHMGGGKVQESINPATGEVIAVTQMGNAQDYDNCIGSLDSERARW